MKTTFKSVFCLAVLTCTLVGTAPALTVASGTVPFSFSGVTSSPAGTLVTDAQFTIASVAASSDGTGSFDTCPASPDCVASGSAASFNPDPFTGDALLGLVLTFGVGGRFTYTVTSQDAPVLTPGGAGETFDNIVTNGTFADSGGDFSSADASLIFTFDQTCGTGCSLSGAATFSTPPITTTTPEPAMLMLTGGALLGIGFFFRRATKH